MNGASWSGCYPIRHVINGARCLAGTFIHYNIMRLVLRVPHNRLHYTIHGGNSARTSIHYLNDIGFTPTL